MGEDAWGEAAGAGIENARGDGGQSCGRTLRYGAPPRRPDTGVVSIGSALIDDALVDGAFEAGLDEGSTALAYALRRLRDERAGRPRRIVAWESCLLPPPPTGFEPGRAA